MTRPWLLASVLLFACKDHSYRHEISGRVVHADAPLAGAVVQRINDKGEPYGVGDVYSRTTDEAGRFEFVIEGRGPSPLPQSPWILRIMHPGKPEMGFRDLAFNASWSDDRAVCYGYCARDLQLELP